MEDKERFDDTISGMSLQDILDEIESDVNGGDDELMLDEILAEFSDAPKKNDADNEKTIKDLLENFEKHDPLLFEEKPAPKISPVIKKEPVQEDISDKKEARMIDTVIRPWENGVYGDMSLEDTVTRKEKKKKRRTSNFAETFDTFTRSELFEEKSTVNVLETRTVEEIIKENSKVSKLLGIRCVILLILSVISCYVAFSEPLGWYFPRLISYIVHPFRYLFLTAFLQICAMLLSVDVLSRGFARLFRLKPDVDSAIAFSSFATLVHVITIMAAPQWRGWLPYSCITVVGLFFALYGKWINARAVCRVCKTVKSAKRPNLVRVENIYGENNIIKSNTEDTRSFVSHINDKDASYTFWTFLSPLVIVSSVVFACVASFGTKTPQHFFWALAGISSVSTPFFTMLSFAFPFSVTEKSLHSIGVAISGWFSATNLAKKASVIVTDNDIFPKGTVTLHGLKVLGSFSLEQTVCYAASVIGETKSGLSDVFADLLKSRYGVRTGVKNLRYHESGGIEAEISNDTVLVGSAGFMLRSGVRLASGTNTKNAVFIAINGEPAGVFNINYKANIDVERALHLLVKKRVPVVLAVRDFNMLPMMVEQTFSLRDGTLEYPEVEQRVDLSSEEQFVSNDAVAVITRSGLYPFSAAVLAAKKLRHATIRNILFTVACSVIGMMFMFYLMFIQKPILVTPHTVFLYMLLWCVPSYLLSLRVKK
ncbi:MAG: hypothetical protein IJE70_04825 [Oscillospiraceae bacterium]|nr:hypothetical protein [Oscillospiraceae bacterium]